MDKPPKLPDTTTPQTVTRTATGPRSRYIQVADLAVGGIRYDLKPAGYALVERMSRQGRDLASIAAALGITSTTFVLLRKRDQAAVEALERGRGGLGDELTDILLTQARNGVTVAAIFLAKARCGWREGEAMPGGVVVNKQTFNINLPEPKEREAYLKLVSGQGAPVIEHKPEEPTDDGDL